MGTLFSAWAPLISIIANIVCTHFALRLSYRTWRDATGRTCYLLLGPSLPFAIEYRCLAPTLYAEKRTVSCYCFPSSLGPHLRGQPWTASL